MGSGQSNPNTNIPAPKMSEQDQIAEILYNIKISQRNASKALKESQMHEANAKKAVEANNETKARNHLISAGRCQQEYEMFQAVTNEFEKTRAILRNLQAKQQISQAFSVAANVATNTNTVNLDEVNKKLNKMKLVMEKNDLDHQVMKELLGANAPSTNYNIEASLDHMKNEIAMKAQTNLSDIANATEQEKQLLAQMKKA